jgi:hypothetical protein
MPRFRDIPQISVANYSANTSWCGLSEKLCGMWGNINGEIIMDPDYQRGHVWTKRQQTEYIEYILRGGISGKDIYWNCPGWMSDFRGPMELVDGKQRINAVLKFQENKVKVFDHYFREFTDKLDWVRHQFLFHVNDLKNRADVIQWYLDLNSGTPHARKDILKAKILLLHTR